jgi:hypothetical protein
MAPSQTTTTTTSTTTNAAAMGFSIPPPRSSAFTRLQYVCGILDMMDRAHGQVKTTKYAPPYNIPSSRCFELLHRAFQTNTKETKEVSMRDLWNLVNVLYMNLTQLHDEHCPVNAALLPDEFSVNDVQLKESMKGEIVSFLVRTAKDFACSSKIDQDEFEEPGIVPHTFSARNQWNLEWTRTTFDVGGRPCYKLKARDNITYYLYFRSGSQRWVIDDEVIPMGSGYSVSANADMNSEWSTSAFWEPNKDVRVTPKDNGYVISGCKGQPGVGGTSCSTLDNGHYKPHAENINDKTHYVLNTPELNAKKESRHLIYSKTDDCWKICPACREDEGCYLKGERAQKTPDVGTWFAVPKDVVDNVVWRLQEPKRKKKKPGLTTTTTPAPAGGGGNANNAANAAAATTTPTEPPSTEEEEQLLMSSIMPWNDQNHETFLFSNTNHTLAFFSKKPEVMRGHMNPSLLKFLTTNKVTVGENLDDAKADYYRLLSALTNVNRAKGDAEKLLGDLATRYALTGDALLKMLAIVQRLRCGIPVVLVGECGCGKTVTIKYLAKWLCASLVVLDIHGGTTKEDVQQKVQDAEKLAMNNDAFVMLFLDEVNTCKNMGLIEEIVVQRKMDGRLIHPKVAILAALNPYRVKKSIAIKSGDVGNDGLDFMGDGLRWEPNNGASAAAGGGGSNENSTSTAALEAIKKEKNLVYLVHPVPRSMLDLAFDFGALDAKTEIFYIRSMTNTTIQDNIREFPRHAALVNASMFQDIVAELIGIAQTFVRKYEQDVAAASLRDAQRSLNLLIFFLKLSESRFGPHGSKKDTPGISAVMNCAVLGLAFSHMFRLPSHESREEFWTALAQCDALKHANERAYTEFSCKPKTFMSVVAAAQRSFCSRLVLEDGIALNSALSENLFVTIICCLNKLPIFMVGKPGTSKTLALSVAATNLQGQNSPSPFFRRYPALSLFTYQCSPLSTAVEIKRQFDMACRFQLHATDQIAVFVMDEVGLAEFSPDMPLKVLHQILVNPPVAVVGVSNWTLDRAKMNRAILLSRPEPSVLDMRFTASKSLAASSGNNINNNNKAPGNNRINSITTNSQNERRGSKDSLSQGKDFGVGDLIGEEDTGAGTTSGTGGGEENGSGEVDKDSKKDKDKKNDHVPLADASKTITTSGRIVSGGGVDTAPEPSWLSGVADAFHEVYLSQDRGREFWGMRDFYSLVKVLKRMQMESPSGRLGKEELVFAVCRNFGGKPEKTREVVDIFLQKVFGGTAVS